MYAGSKVCRNWCHVSLSNIRLKKLIGENLLGKRFGKKNPMFHHKATSDAVLEEVLSILDA